MLRRSLERTRRRPRWLAGRQRLTFEATLSKIYAARGDEFRDFLFGIMIAPYGAEISTFEDFGGGTTSRTSTGCMCATYFSWTAKDLFCFRFKPLAFLRSYFCTPLVRRCLARHHYHHRVLFCEFFHIVFDFISDILIRTNVVAWFLWSYGCASRKAQ